MTNIEAQLCDLCDAYITHGPLNFLGCDLNFMKGTYKIGKKTFTDPSKAMAYLNQCLENPFRK
jgi:hypothetical protein